MPPRAHPLAVSRFAALADSALAAIWRSGMTPRPPLDPEYLWSVGSRGHDTDDEIGGRPESDVADFRERLDRICQSLRDEAGLNALGHTMAYGQLTAAIRKRHALGRMWRESPHLSRTQLAAPIVVVGQMRSGTTRIHRLLAADPSHAATRFCDSFDPVPATPDARPLKAAAALAIGRRINPWLDTLHPFGATRSDEEIGWLSAALNPCAFEAQWHIPSYVAWSEARSASPVYGEFERILRTDAAVRGNADRPRILKCPQYSEDLAALLRAFPDARVVVAQRDADAVIDSTVSMVAGQSAFQSSVRSLESIREEWKRKLALRHARIEASLADFTGHVARVPYAALDSDWGSAIAVVYSALDLPLTTEALAAMEREQASAASSPHHAHAKSLDQFAEARS